MYTPVNNNNNNEGAMHTRVNNNNGDIKHTPVNNNNGDIKHTPVNNNNNNNNNGGIMHAHTCKQNNGVSCLALCNTPVNKNNGGIIKKQRGYNVYTCKQINGGNAWRCNGWPIAPYFIIYIQIQFGVGTPKDSSLDCECYIMAVYFKLSN